MEDRNIHMELSEETFVMRSLKNSIKAMQAWSASIEMSAIHWIEKSTSTHQNTLIPVSPPYPLTT